MPNAQNKPSNTPSSPSPINELRASREVPMLDATMDHQSDFAESTDRRDGAAKHHRDLAFAVALLHSGLMTARGLTRAITNWTSYGSSSLATYLVATDAIEKDQCAKVEQQAARSLTQAADRLQSNGRADGTSERSPSSQWGRQLLTELDPTGRVAKKLGIADAAILSGDEIEDRTVGARYTLLRKLGQGGLGIVWLARDENLQRYVAVKEISREVTAGDSALKHFRREAEITGRLEHPGIVPVYQYGEDKTSGKSFYAMRFLGKKTLQDALTEYHERREAGNATPIMLHRLLTALISVCNAVGHAHSRNVIHRDLKPENIALDEFGQVTLLDWGLAKINDETGMYDVNGRTEPGDLHSIGTSQLGRVLGTPLYMAPEQAAGRLEEVDELSDVYGLGGILYAIITGFGPHQPAMESTDSGGSRPEVLSRIVAGAVTAPRTLVSCVPPELNAICLKALSTKRYLRYESASELADDVQRFIAGSPVEAYDAPLKQRVTRWMANHPTLAQAILLMTTMLSLGGAGIAYTARQGQTALQKAEYVSVIELASEIGVNLRFETQQLERDLRFITELPLTEAITKTQSNISDTPRIDSNGENRKRTEPPTPEQGTLHADQGQLTIRDLSKIDPNEWLLRQNELFAGLLSANPAYLVMKTCRKNQDDSYTELVRCGRVRAGQPPQRVPKKRLVTCKPNESEEEHHEAITTMRPGQSMLVTNDRIGEHVPTNNRSAMVLSGLRAIYDADGDLFGMNIIELDLRKRLEGLLTAVAHERVSVYVTDMDGCIVMNYYKGRFSQETLHHSIIEEFPSLKAFYSPNSIVNEQGDGKTHYAKRVRLGGNNQMAQIGIVAHIHADDE